MDGANTTFFVNDSGRDLDTFPNFFGTSCAAPSAAGIGALLLQTHGGPGSVTPSQMKSVLQRSAFPHDLEPYFAQGVAAVFPVDKRHKKHKNT
jgi:Subtilase family